MTGRRLGGAIVAAAVVVLSPVGGRAADVHVGINIGVPPPPQVVIEAPPPLVVVPRSPVYYAPELPYNYFYYGGLYYTFHEGAWFSAVSFRGPWGFVAVNRVPRPLLAVPVQYYKVPPGHWKKHHGPPRWARDDDHGDDRGHGHGHGRGHGHGHHDD